MIKAPNGFELSGPAKTPSDHRAEPAESALEDPAFFAGQRVVRPLRLVIRGRRTNDHSVGRAVEGGIDAAMRATMAPAPIDSAIDTKETTRARATMKSAPAAEDVTAMPKSDMSRMLATAIISKGAFQNNALTAEPMRRPMAPTAPVTPPTCAPTRPGLGPASSLTAKYDARPAAIGHTRIPHRLVAKAVARFSTAAAPPTMRLHLIDGFIGTPS